MLSASILGFILFFFYSNNSDDGLTGTSWIEPKTFKVRFFSNSNNKRKLQAMAVLSVLILWSIGAWAAYVTLEPVHACPETVFELNHPCNDWVMLLNNMCQSLFLYSADSEDSSWSCKISKPQRYTTRVSGAFVCCKSGKVSEIPGSAPPSDIPEGWRTFSDERFHCLDNGNLGQTWCLHVETVVRRNSASGEKGEVKQLWVSLKCSASYRK